jgi:hypothetical protein
VPVSFYYDEETQVVYETGVGEVTYQCLLDYIARLGECPLADEIRGLADYTDCTMKLPLEEFSRLQNIFRDGIYRERRVRTALCAASGLNFGLARKYSVLSSDGMREIQVFRTVAEGREWLGLPPV